MAGRQCPYSAPASVNRGLSWSVVLGPIRSPKPRRKPHCAAAKCRTPSLRSCSRPWTASAFRAGCIEARWEFDGTPQTRLPAGRLDDAVRTLAAPTPRWGWRRVSVVGPGLPAGRRRWWCGNHSTAGRRRWCWNHSHISRQAIVKLLSTRGKVETAIALPSILGGKPVAVGCVSRGRWCGPHNTSGEGRRCGADRGHQYSRLHVGIPLSLEADGNLPPLVTAVTACLALRWQNSRVFPGERTTAGLLLRLLSRPSGGSRRQGGSAGHPRRSGVRCVVVRLL